MVDLPIAKIVAGVDEAGRGPLAGSVVASAVILNPEQSIPGLTDSKKLTANKRAMLETQIKESAIAWAIAEASIEEIDDINILHASMLAMKRAVLKLSTVPQLVLVDGNREPDLPGYSVQAIIKGDLTEPSISAASVLAKEFRDRQMMTLDAQFPQYQFAKHKGYPTQLHRDLLAQHGVSPVHRRSFKPVRDLL